MTGVIYKGIGGFYYVKTADGQMVECKPRGIFRKTGQKPVAGDKVALVEEAGTITMDEILPRRNVFVRPPIANVDQFVVVASTVEPTPSFLVIDKLTAVALDNDAQPLLVVTKTDLATAQPFVDAYGKSGIDLLAVNAETGEGLAELHQHLAGKLSVLCGNSGVGKSTLLNALLPQLSRETAEISQKLGRGRHTTREVEIFDLPSGQIADTPGFASLDLQRAAPIVKENLQFAFPEIEKRMQNCKFTGCAHIAEQGCAVRQAAFAGEISESRYNSYVTLYQEAKENERY
ncbi:ribosome small subunit-dependent GTPase A [Ruminococcaceae bacterium OttesenSCG-928-A16]|nr:ribosome small subunit-dependent GTPase A [Ruminococcaceae bacterium OttesenSCG-928-A16]